MDLAQPLSSIIPTLDADVLTVLARSEQPLTGRRIAALARRGTHPAIQKILDRLVAHGVVHAQPAGPARLYRLNRAHLLAAPILAAVTVRETLLNRFREAIDSWPVPCVHASLFGSFTRGEAGPESDIDVLVIRPNDVADDDATWNQQLIDLERQIALWSGNTLSWFDTTEGSLTRALAGDGPEGEEPIITSWRKDALHLSGEPLAHLLARLQQRSSPAGSR